MFTGKVVAQGGEEKTWECEGFGSYSLAPVGRRVSVETLAGKRLAIDVSIWMVQFIKAMKDEKSDMV